MPIYIRFFLFLFFFSGLLYSQNDLRGLLVDEQNQPVAFANVILLNAQDSTGVYKGSVSQENGSFVLENIADSVFLFKASFIGYKDVLRRLDISGDKDLGKIIMSEASDQLDEVTITGRKPKITREIDRLVFDVENSSLSSGNTWNILRRSPGVIDNQGQLLVRNAAVQIYINDRKVYLSATELKTLLESYSAENIKLIEVITNPPAKYDAEGGAILNIVTSKSISPGYKGSVEGSYTQGVYSKFKLGTSHYFQGDKLNVFANYSFSPRKDYKNDDSYINFIRDGQLFSRWETDFTRATTSRAHNANAILDYTLSEKSSLNFSVNGNFSPKRNFNNDVSTEIYNAQMMLDSTLITDSEVNTDQDNIALNASFTTSLENGGDLTLMGHYTKFNQQRDQHILSRYFNSEGNSLGAIEFDTNANQDINIATAQVDYSGSLGSSVFEIGSKYSMIDSESGIDYFNAGELRNLYSDLSNNFLYDENIFAGYVSLSHDWEKWSAKAGLRGEYTDRQGESTSTNDVLSRNYFELFPTAFLQYRASENHNFTLDYSRRIQRPRYESLNPFRYFLNETNYNSGNPNLIASISDNFNLNYTLKNAYFFDLYYRDHGRTPETLPFQDNEKLTIRYISQNLLESKGYGIDMYHARSITNFWYAQIFTSIFHQQNTLLAIESNNAEVTREIDGIQLYAYNIFTLSKDGTFEGTLFGQYLSNYLSGSYKLEPMTTVTVGLRKTLWNNRAELTLNFNDIFNTTNTRLTSGYLNQSNSFFSNSENQTVQVGFKYNFGNFRLEDNERSIDAAERDRLKP
ncbi:TonB-dependent receptor [Gramella sp. AN32]|nr:TonB-dependent receptor [Gramella sp. AN32]